MQWPGRSVDLLGSLDHRRLALGAWWAPKHERLSAAATRASLPLSALVARPAHRRRRTALADTVVGADAPPTTSRRAVMVVVDGLDHEHAGLVVDARWLPSVRDAPDVELVCLRTDGVEPLDERWIDRLSAALGGPVVAAAPTTVHPDRGVLAATPHDLLVHTVGARVALDREGQPVLEALGAGASPADPSAHPQGGDQATIAVSCIVLPRKELERVGGLRPGLGGRAAIVELSLRLRAAGGTIAAVPEVLVLDREPVDSWAMLRHPVPPTSRPWREIVDLHGPALRRSAFEGSPPPRVALTTAAPPGLVARRWGDWEFAHALARALAGKGVETRVQARDAADTLASRTCDVQLVLRGLLPVRRTDGQRHVLWVISHPESVAAAELDDADLVLAASGRLAEHLRRRTTTPVEVLRQATDHHRFRPARPHRLHQHEITVVANTRGMFRPAVAGALAAGLRPAIYGEGWTGLVDRSLVVARHVPNRRLPVVYSSAGVVLNDHWAEMRDLGMVANRVYDVLACGTPLVSDAMPELNELFGDVVPTFIEEQDVGTAVATVLEDPARARARAEEGRRLVLAAHTFDRRAGELLDVLREHDLLPGAAPR